MAHEIPKIILEHADTIANRRIAIETALGLGMPLQEIEGYLDWLDAKSAKYQPDKMSSE